MATGQRERRDASFELTEQEVCVVRDALVKEMARTCKIMGEHLGEHLGGSNVGLADARHWLRTLDELAGILERLDPPGWQETLGKLKAVA